MREVRQIIVEEDMKHPLIGGVILDEMGFVASQHLESVRDKFHLHDFSHIGEQLLKMGKQPLGALSNLLLKHAVIPKIIEDLPNVGTLANKKTRRLGSKQSQTRLMKIRVKYSGAKMMTVTMTCYSPT
jgi:hypothetical protein